MQVMRLRYGISNCCPEDEEKWLIKKELIDYKGGCCFICGYNKSYRSLHFHHLNPKEKDFTLGSKWGKLGFNDEIKKELDKCILVCANCHREVHYELKQKETQI
jgi:5-methylcytosine-specific restriction endonuclease McrA